MNRHVSFPLCDIRTTAHNRVYSVVARVFYMLFYIIYGWRRRLFVFLTRRGRTTKNKEGKRTFETTACTVKYSQRRTQQKSR